MAGALSCTMAQASGTGPNSKLLRAKPHKSANRRQFEQQKLSCILLVAVLLSCLCSRNRRSPTLNSEAQYLTAKWLLAILAASYGALQMPGSQGVVLASSVKIHIHLSCTYNMYTYMYCSNTVCAYRAYRLQMHANLDKL